MSVRKDASVTIMDKDGDGSLTAEGGHCGAGIGGSTMSTVKDVTISGGKVTANGGNYVAAIGAGYKGAFGAVEITGSDIMAVSGKRASAIGDGTSTKTFAATGGTRAGLLPRLTAACLRM